MATKVAMYFSYKNFLFVISRLSSIILTKISYLAQGVSVSEIFPNLHHSLMSVYDLSYFIQGGAPLLCFLQNISQIAPMVLEKKSFYFFLPFMGMTAILNV